MPELIFFTLTLKFASYILARIAVSLLPICRKVFEKIFFNSLFVHSDSNNFLNSNPSWFRPGDSCLHQLISITRDKDKALDANPTLEVREVFVDLSKAFDKV